MFDMSKRSVPRTLTLTMTTSSHAGQRATAPGAFVYTRSSAIIVVVWQCEHRTSAIVISWPKCSNRAPAIAFPSSASISSSPLLGLCACRAKALGSDAPGIVSFAHERLRSGLDEPGGTADVDEGTLAWRPRELLQKFNVDSPSMSRPVLGPLTGQRDPHLD